MPRVLKVLRYIGGGLVGLALIAIIAIYVVSEMKLRRTYATPLRSFSASTDSASVTEGARLARIRGCFGGCHGTGLEGKIFYHERGVALIWAPNLTQVVREYSDSELERVIRHGVRRNGRSVFAMPSDMFAELADDDLARILGFLRSQPIVANQNSGFHVGPVGRVGLLAGAYKPMAPQIQATPAQHVPRESEIEWGRYLVRSVCTECHGLDLRGDPTGKPPNLRVAAAYTEAEWFRLMREGRGLTDRDLGLMSRVALTRFRYMSDDELRAIRAYLQQFASAEAGQH